MATNTIEITFNGEKIQVEPGRTILEVAESRGIRIPTLCHDRRLEPYASCWVCLVKVERAKGFVPSCGTKVAPGMVISTGSPDVMAARRMALDLLLSSHYGDCKAPCTLTCPSNIDIQGYLGLMANGKPAEAVQLIRRDNPMPAVIGRICPRPCEEQCRRRLADEPLNINGVKRFLADAEAAAGGMAPRARPEPTGRKVAVIGGGPAGLSAAWYLSERGVAVTVFEAMEKAGGMLRYGIPDYRLPPAVLDRAIEEMLSLGATLKTGVRLGKDLDLPKLQAEFDAVVLAFGAWKSRALRIPGEDHPSVLSGIDFLRDVNAGKPVRVGGTVAIIGGGNTAMDAARCSLRLGARKVSMYYRRGREEMPASNAEIEEALEEGVEIQYLAAPLSLRIEDGRLVGLTLLRMELGEPDASGRRRPVPVEGSEHEVPVDTVISAVGQYSDLKLLSGQPGLVDEKGILQADVQTGITPVAGLFVAGDLLTGTDIAIRAIAGGKHAARAALAYLDGKVYRRPREFLARKSDYREPTAADYQDTPRAPRQRPAVAAAEIRTRGFQEIESTLTAEQAGIEAARCMECGCQDVRDCGLKQYATEYEATGKRFFGEAAIHPIDDSHPFIARDPSKCVLCGRCVRICLEVQGIGVLGYVHRGFASIVAPSFGVSLGEDKSCISCGQCVSACPVGALTEKQPGRKPVPLLETAVEGTCSQCSVGCGVEYRFHGSHFIRVVERYSEPNHGKLCKKGRFGHGFLGDGPGYGVRATADLSAARGDARQAAQRLLAAAKHPRMRISPYLCGEAIDAFLEAASRRGIPVQAAGLEDLDPRWAELVSAAPASRPEVGLPIHILVGDIAASNNVAFTEAYRKRKLGLIELWIAGHEDEVARRVATRLEAGLAAALSAAISTGRPVVALVNPEEAPAEALEALLAVRDRVSVLLLWNSRNAGYLVSKIGLAGTTGGAKGTAKVRAGTDGSPDLLLDVGVEEPGNGARRILWGISPAKQDLFVPLPTRLWTGGRSHPTGSPPVQDGAIDGETLDAVRILS